MTDSRFLERKIDSRFASAVVARGDACGWRPDFGGRGYKCSAIYWGKCFQRSGSENILPLYLSQQTFLSCFFSASPPTPSRPHDRMKRKCLTDRGHMEGAALTLAVRAPQPAVPPTPLLYSVSILELKKITSALPRCRCATPAPVGRASRTYMIHLWTGLNMVVCVAALAP